MQKFAPSQSQNPRFSSIIHNIKQRIHHDAPCHMHHSALNSQKTIPEIPMNPAFLPIPAFPRTLIRRTRHTAITARATRRQDNVAGNVFVDSSCIDCDICRWVAPETFHSSRSQSAVHTQPNSRELVFRAMQAAASCPTGSIRVEQPVPEAREAVRSFPTPAGDGSEGVLSDVYYNGYASEDTFGASSWLVVTERGNVMFDCPRFNTHLAKRIEEMGGLKYIVLSHRDDVAGHDRWAGRFGAERVIHEAECSEYQGTDKCEIKLKDTDMDYELLPGLKILHVAGHTSGSIAMLHEKSKSLFTGDHLGYSERVKGLSGFPRYCRHSWSEQLENIGRLADVDFLHGFPGHGRQFHFANAQERRSELMKAIEQMRGVAARSL